MKNIYLIVFVFTLALAGCAVQTKQGMTINQLNNAVGLSGNGNLTLINRVGEYEIYQSSAVIDWKKQISQGNQIAKSILTPDKNVYYIVKGGVLQQEIIGDNGINNFITKAQPPLGPSSQFSSKASSASPNTQQRSNSTNDPSNFLIGLCDISSTPKSDPRITSCQVSDLGGRPVWLTGVNIYGPNSVTYLLIFGRKERESSSGGNQNQNSQSTVTYKIENPNSIIATLTTPSGCSYSDKFTKVGSDIFRQTISLSDRCRGSQARALQDSIKDGKVKFDYLRMN